MADSISPQDAIWNQVKETLYLTREQFLETLAGWNIDPLYNENGLFAAVLTQGPKFHCMTFGTKWALNKEILQKYPGSLIAEFGYAETFTPKDDARQNRFNRRLGFYVTHEDADYIHYRIDRMSI